MVARGRTPSGKIGTAWASAAGNGHQDRCRRLETAIRRAGLVRQSAIFAGHRRQAMNPMSIAANANDAAPKIGKTPKMLAVDFAANDR